MRRWRWILGVGLAVAGCADATGPRSDRVLGELWPAEELVAMEVADANPSIEVLPGGRVSVRIITIHTCHFLRSEAEVVRRERTVVVFPYEIRESCAERPARSGTHELTLAFDGAGPVLVQVIGRGRHGGEESFTARVVLE